jgi:hypothetical protein
VVGPQSSSFGSEDHPKGEESDMSIKINSTIKALTGLVLDLPFDHRRVPGPSAYRQKELSVPVASHLVERMTELAGQESISLPSIYLAGYAILLSRYANTPETMSMPPLTQNQRADLPLPLFAQIVCQS